MHRYTSLKYAYSWIQSINKRTECGPSQFGSSRERIAAANAANVQYAGQQRVIIIITRQPTLGPRPGTFLSHFQEGDCSYSITSIGLIHRTRIFKCTWESQYLWSTMRAFMIFRRWRHILSLNLIYIIFKSWFSFISVWLKMNFSSVIKSKT